MLKLTWNWSTDLPLENTMLLLNINWISCQQKKEKKKNQKMNCSVYFNAWEITEALSDLKEAIIFNWALLQRTNLSLISGGLSCWLRESPVVDNGRAEWRGHSIARGLKSSSSSRDMPGRSQVRADFVGAKPSQPVTRMPLMKSYHWRTALVCVTHLTSHIFLNLLLSNTVYH